MSQMLKLPGHFHLPHYFKSKLSTQMEELYLSVAIMDFAVAAIALFEPIYLWSIGYRIPQIMFFYLIVYILYFPLVPLGGKFVSKFGHERSILISTFFYVGYYAALIGIRDHTWMFALAPLLYALQKTFYWPAYHFDFIRFSAKEERASEFSGLWALTTLMYVLGPVAGGFLVKYFGFTFFFTAASAMILLSSIPHFFHRAVRKPESYSYWRSLLMPFRRRYWRSTVAYLGNGSELILLTVWPIFVSLVFGDFLKLGALASLSALVTALVTLWIGKWSDRTSRHHVLSVGGLGGGVVWLLRMLTRFPPFVFVFDMFGRIGYNMVVVSMTSTTYDRAHEDDYSWHAVYYEQGFALGKALMCALVIALSTFADPFTAAFFASAIFSLLYIVF